MSFKLNNGCCVLIMWMSHGSRPFIFLQTSFHSFTDFSLRMAFQSIWPFTTKQVAIATEFQRAQAFVKTSCLLLSRYIQYRDVAVMSSNLILLHISVTMFCFFNDNSSVKDGPTCCTVFHLHKVHNPYNILHLMLSFICVSLLGLSSSF